MTANPVQPLAVRPIVPTGIMTEFGEAIDSPEGFGVMHDQMADVTYIPGYSELRIQRDQQLGEVVAGLRKPQDVMTLPVNLHLARRSRRDGTPDAFKVIQHGNKGARPVTSDEVGSEWFREIPTAASVLPDGTIAIGDTVLMVTGRERAAQNALAKMRRTEAMQASVEAKTEDHGITRTQATSDPIRVGSQLPRA